MSGNTVQEFITSGEAILAGAAMLGGLALLLRKIAALTRKAVHAFDEILGGPGQTGLVEEIRMLKTSQDAIKKELHPNGGSTLRDAVARVEAAMLDVKGMAVDAKRVALEAATETGHLQSQLSDADSKGGSQRAALAAEFQSLSLTVSDFIIDQRQREVAYLLALRTDHGVDLTGVADQKELP